MPSYKYQTAQGRTMWFCSFYYQEYNGRRMKKKKSGFSTKRDADAYERDFLLKRSGSPSMTFLQLAENYLDDCSHRLKGTTVHLRATVARTRLLPVFGDMPLETISPTSVRSWENDLLQDGTLSTSYIKAVRGVLSEMFNFAVRFYGLASNPVRMAGPIKANARKQEGARLHVWTREQFARFITSGLDAEYIALFSTLFWTGLRVGEALALTVSDVDLDANTLHVSKTVSRIQQDLCISYVAEKPKTSASVRAVSMPLQLSMILADWMRQSGASNAASMLFGLSMRGNASTVFAKRVQELKLPRIRIHDLRHSHASMLINMGFEPMVIRDRLGHKDIQTTLNTYSHLYPEKMDDVASRLSLPL